MLSAMILAGGLGTRLRPAVADRPKVMALVNGRPFLSYLLDQLVDAGVRDVVLCVGYLGDAVLEAFQDSYRGSKIRYSREDVPLGTGGALRHALKVVSGDAFLIMNGDSYCDLDLRAFVECHRDARAAASIALTRVDDVRRYGSVTVDPHMRVLDFEEKGVRSGAGLINAGIYLLDKGVLAAIPEGKPVSLEREVFPRLIGGGINGFHVSGRFIDIGTPESYRCAAEFFGGA
ncbi:MAG: hypothetical protein A2516_02580 [Alphaproteobacteria bacterium RIFOXYD12_FULL_60_8]|nr:MAG: hypothetical protein A2516_02580 [Alphaproteobacteria bacterium RIFOXYD12_FULL_60_8]